MIKVFVEPQAQDWPILLERPSVDENLLKDKVQAILMQVKQKGDEALAAYTLSFDKVALTNFQLSSSAFDEAAKIIAPSLKKAIQVAKANIEIFHQAQIQKVQTIETMPGVLCWRKSIGIEKVGIYIPGGSAPLFSTVLMLGIPAKLAGCKEIILCTPPQQDGKIDPAIIYAASLIGINAIYTIGGVQAIGAMAYGTASVPKVHKIFGPGNQFVTIAKQIIQQEGVAIDLPAGPSEVCVYADQTSIASFVAADLLSQAEHGADSQVLLIANTLEVAQAVQKELEKQCAQLPRQAVAKKSLENSKAVALSNVEQAISMINEYAPEHLILSINNAAQVAEKIINAGSVFIGNFSPESVGDYASGTNHTLPTRAYARAYSGVSVESFLKSITFQELTPQGLAGIGPAVMVMAEAEGLQAHANAIRVRLEKKP